MHNVSDWLGVVCADIGTPCSHGVPEHEGLTHKSKLEDERLCNELCNDNSS